MDVIPVELLNYRYLMHPIRLSIMKLLDQYNKLTSITIKHLMGVTWGEYRNHIISLSEKGYVIIGQEFNEDGHLVQYAEILEIGRTRYVALLDALRNLLDSSSPIISLIQAKDEKSRLLYPDNTENVKGLQNSKTSK